MITEKISSKKLSSKIKRDDWADNQHFEVLNLLCQDFFLSINSFTEHNFTGAVKMNFPERIEGGIRVSPRGFSYFIMLMLYEISGNSMITVDIEEISDFIKVTVSDFDLVQNTEYVLNTAKNSGFSVVEIGKSLVLSAKIGEAKELDVFSSGSLVLINYLYEAYFECFE